MAKKQTKKKPDQMERVRAVRAKLGGGTAKNGENVVLDAFMAIFHPEKYKDNDFMDRIRPKKGP